MKKKYTISIVFLMFIFTQNSLAQGPWTFTNSNDGWVSTGTSANVTASATYSVLDINGAGNPQITRSDANVDGTALYYAIIKIKNNTSNTLMRFIYDTTGTNRFTDTQISANDTEFKTYYVRVDNHADWNTNPVNNITIQFRADHTTPGTTANDDGLGNIYIDDLTMSTEIERTDFTFNNPEDNGGFEAFGQASLNQNATTGVYELTATNDKFPGLGLVNNFKVPATANRFVAITFDTNTATTVNQITIKIIDPTDQYLNLSITAASGVLQTVVMDLNGKTSWNADETSFVISFREQAGGAQPFSGQINVHRVLFFNTEWTGQTDTDWATTTNWSSGAVPLITDPIHIPSGLTNNPIIGSTTGANAKDIINDGSITINSGGSLIVDGSSSGNVTYNRTLTTPAETGDFNADKLEYGDFSVTFRVDEDMKNYLEIHNWLIGIAFPDNFTEHKNLVTRNQGDGSGVFSDATLTVLNSTKNVNVEVTFEDLLPTSISDIQLDVRATDINYSEATANFRYKRFTIKTV